jgi:hypothetical protein
MPKTTKLDTTTNKDLLKKFAERIGKLEKKG